MTFYCADAATFVAPLRSWLLNIANAMPASVSMQIESVGDVLESATGQITGQWTASVGLPVPGQGVGAYLAPAGFLVSWETPAFLSGRRLRGRTFIVPAMPSTFDSSGTITPAALIGIKGDADNFIAGTTGNFYIWQRPRAARAATGTSPAVAARGGGFSTVTGSRVPDKAVVLRSRRD